MWRSRGGLQVQDVPVEGDRPVQVRHADADRANAVDAFAGPAAGSRHELHQIALRVPCEDEDLVPDAGYPGHPGFAAERQAPIVRPVERVDVRDPDGHLADADVAIAGPAAQRAWLGAGHADEFEQDPAARLVQDRAAEHQLLAARHLLHHLRRHIVEGHQHLGEAQLVAVEGLHPAQVPHPEGDVVHA